MNFSSFQHKMRMDLRYRLVTAMLVCILPIAIVGCILFGIVWNRSEREMHEAQQIRLDEAMSYWERDTSTIDRAISYFVSQYLPELNNENLVWNDVLRYEMFEMVELILPEAEHSGIAALYDVREDKVLCQMRTANQDAGLIDRQVREFSRRIQSGPEMPDDTWQEIDGRYYLIERYDYHNASIYFALDVGNSILDRTEPLRSADTVVYVADGAKIVRLSREEAVETDLTWEDCTRSTLQHSSLSWKSERLPIAVCLVDDSTILERLPKESLALLAIMVICLGSVLNLPRLIRLEVLDPARKLRDAMHEIQLEHLDFRLHDTFYRNSEDMQYLFDTFDEMADEIEASREKDKKMYQAEMDNLRLQVNPHMLLNSLNTIYSLAQMKKFEAIQEYALHLVDYFRYALRRNDNLVTVEQELDFIKTYIEIQKIRYPGLLSFVYAIGKECGEASVPPLLIQNFVENSVKYAVKPGRVTEILLNVNRRDDRLEISVTDTGTGMKPEILEALRTGEPFVDAMGQKHIGIWNCRRRIEVFYNEAPNISIVSGQGGTQIFLDVPYQTEEHQ